MKVLDTKGILHYEELMISKSKNFLYIFSPYLSISNKIQTLLLETKLLHTNLKVSIICGKEILEEQEYNKIMQMPIDLYFVENLHAKIMINEKFAVVSSMNVYEASESNFEAGILFSNTRESERKQYDYLKNYCENIFSEKDKYSKVIGDFEKKYPFKTENWHLLKSILLKSRENTDKWECLQDSITDYAKHLTEDENLESKNTLIPITKYNALVTKYIKFKEDFLDLKSSHEEQSKKIDIIVKMLQEQKLSLENSK